MFIDNDDIFLKFKKEWIDELISQYDYVYNLDNANVGKDKMKCIEKIMKGLLKGVLSDVNERSFVDVKMYLLKRFAEYGVDLNVEDEVKQTTSNKVEKEQNVQGVTSNSNKNVITVVKRDDNDKENENVLKKKTKRGRKPLIKVDNHNINKSPIKQNEHTHNINITTSSSSSPIKTRSNSKQPHSHSPKQNTTPVKSPYSSSKSKKRCSSSPLSSSSKQETPSPIRKLSIKPKPIIKNTQLFEINNESQISLRSRNNSSSKRSYKSSDFFAKY